MKKRHRTASVRLHVWALMAPGRWWSLVELAQAVRRRLRCMVLTTGLSARVRDLRKQRYGGHDVRSRRRKGSKGTWEYRLVR